MPQSFFLPFCNNIDIPGSNLCLPQALNSFISKYQLTYLSLPPPKKGYPSAFAIGIFFL